MVVKEDGRACKAYEKMLVEIGISTSAMSYNIDLENPV